MKKWLQNVCWRPLLLIFGLALFSLIVYLLRIPCLSVTLFDVYCPSCGTTRVIDGLLHGDFASAFRNNPLITLLFPFITAVLVYCVWSWLHGKRTVLLEKLPKWVYPVILIVLAVYGILRNIPSMGFLVPLEIVR